MTKNHAGEVIAVITARSGSKRIPGKNIKLLEGKPLIAWTIETALSANCFSRIIVSTDDQEIADVALEYGAEVPWLRSLKNSTDKSTSVDTVIEVLERIEADGESLPDSIMLLQPTSPFRKIETIKRAVSKYRNGRGESVVSVSPAKTNPYWYRTISDDGGILPFLCNKDSSVRSQDLSPVYMLNGLIYISSVANLVENRDFYTPHTQALIVDDAEESIDIDTPFDWLIAETLAEMHQRNHI